jgi:hypothetical protein
VKHIFQSWKRYFINRFCDIFTLEPTSKRGCGVEKEYHRLLQIRIIIPIFLLLKIFVLYSIRVDGRSWPFWAVYIGNLDT